MGSFCRFYSGLAGLLFSLLFVSCQREEETAPNKFDRSLFLTNMADGFIIPAYNQLFTEVEALDSKAETFTQNPNQTNLEALQNSWLSAYSVWQKANSFNFGPAGESGTRKTLLEEIAVFPVSESKINSILDGNRFNVNDFNRDARGFLAIEYLIFRKDANQELMLMDFQSQNRKIYLKALTQHLKDRIESVVNTWKGGFREQFIKNNGTESGSSTSQFYNEFVRSFEALKNFKVGLPLGKRPGQTSVDPTLLEAQYSGRSLDFLQLHLKNLHQIWHGKPYLGDADGIGFKEYLENVEGGTALINLSESQMQEVTKSLNAIPQNARMSELLQTNLQLLDNVHTELQKQTRFFKSDMSSVLGIAITYSSGDGD